MIKKYWHITIIILFLIFIAGVVYIIYPPFEKLKFGLDLSGGSQIILIPEDKVSEDFINKSFIIMKDRLSRLNLAEPRITMDESNRILVQLPKVENLNRVLNVIRNRGQLEFKIIEGVDIGLKYAEKEKIEISPEEVEQTTTNILDKLKEIVGEENIEYEKINDFEFNLRLKKIDIQRAYIAILQIIMQESAEKETFERIEFTKYDPVYGDKVEIGEHLKDAEPRSVHRQYPQIKNSVILFLDKEIEKKFRDLIEQNIGESLSVVLDGVIKSISAIDEETIPSEEVSTLYIPQIETFEEARNIATILQTGPMPVNFKVFENTNVGPTLGEDIIYKSLITISVSFLLLLIFILIYYRGPGLFSDIGFIFFSILLFSSMVLMKVVLTTFSICGIFMSITLFLFSNIYILEKIKDELKIGRAMIISVDFGFKNSLNDVLYINAAVFIISIMLNYMGTMQVRILSFPLIMGSILTIVTLFTFTRSSLLLSSNLFQKFRLIPFLKRKSKFEQVNYNFISKKKVWLIISAIIMILGLASLFLKWGLQFGVDFKNNYIIELNFKELIDIEEVRHELKNQNFNFNIIQKVSETRYQIVTDNEEVDKDEIVNIFNKKGLIKDEVKVHKILPFYAKDILIKMLFPISICLAILILIILIKKDLILTLISFITVIFNLLLTISIFSIFGQKLSLIMCVSIISIFIYSITMIISIVIKIGKNRYLIKNKSYEEIINLSLNGVLKVLVTVLIIIMIPIYSLILFGEGLIRSLAILLALGFIVTTFSSIFTSGSLLGILKKYHSAYK